MLGNALAQTCPPVEERDAEVLVFGAGVTGITTARALYDNGLTDVLVLEAEDHIGGRINNTMFGGVQIELGANWIQEVNRKRDSNPIWTIAHSTNICPTIFTSSTPLANTISNYSNYEAFDERKNVTLSFQTARKAAFKALESAEDYSIQLQLDGANDVNMRVALDKFGWTPSNPTEDVADWYNFDFCYGEEPENTSLFVAYPAMDKYDFGDSDYFVTDQRGFSKVVECIAEGLPKDSIRLGHTVNNISYNDDCVCASVTKSDGTERRMCGTYGVATFSVGVLKDFVKKSMFDPQLSTSKLDFLNSIRMAYYLKIFVSFPKTFWNTKVEYIFRSDAQRGRYPLIQPLNLLPGNPNIIMVTVTEDEAVRISNQDKSTTTMEIMEVLRGVYGDDIPEPNDILVPTWINSPFYQGMFSDAAFGLTIKGRERFKEPEGNLYLSGEGNLVGDNGYVHSGYCSGMETSSAILQAIGRPINGSNLPSCPLAAAPVSTDGAARGALSLMLITATAAIVVVAGMPF